VISFEGQVVVVTGAGRGLGAAYARSIAARGGAVVVHDAGIERDGTGGDSTVASVVAQEITAGGGRAEAEVQDLSTRQGCEQLISSVVARHGRIDALVHSAGIVRYHGIVDTSEDDWNRMLAVNVAAPWWLCRAVWPHMEARGYGRIVLTVSGFALRAVPGADVTAYSTGKGAQLGLMNALAAEGETAGIRVNAVSPIAATRIFRRQTEPGELTPEAVAPGVAVLASTACPCTGRVLVAAGGEWALDSMTRTREVDLGSSAQPEAVLDLIEEQLAELQPLDPR
jgi:NAD(P)-dependent dehydrogenase (short-subunit alcohol dehydrogenase family)